MYSVPYFIISFYERVFILLYFKLLAALSNHFHSMVKEVQSVTFSYSVNRPAEGSRLPNAVSGPSACTPLHPCLMNMPGSVQFCCYNTSITLQTPLLNKQLLSISKQLSPYARTAVYLIRSNRNNERLFMHCFLKTVWS